MNTALNEKTSADESSGFLVDELAQLPDKAILDEKHLAGLLKKHPRTIQRMVERGELPPPAGFANHKVWLVSHILSYLENALAKAAQEAEREAARISKFSP
ncbi:MAG: helix-turn-helix domain-containing protein [Planctomycetota bacterium]|jgi:hypothetical protein|nr:helix-turn-helix domain-containing protein [Planctomycetota bacterium]